MDDGFDMQSKGEKFVDEHPTLTTPYNNADNKYVVISLYRFKLVESSISGHLSVRDSVLLWQQWAIPDSKETPEWKSKMHFPQDM